MLINIVHTHFFFGKFVSGNEFESPTNIELKSYKVMLDNIRSSTPTSSPCPETRLGVEAMTQDLLNSSDSIVSSSPCFREESHPDLPESTELSFNHEFVTGEVDRDHDIPSRSISDSGCVLSPSPESMSIDEIPPPEPLVTVDIVTIVTNVIIARTQRDT